MSTNLVEINERAQRIVSSLKETKFNLEVAKLKMEFSNARLRRLNKELKEKRCYQQF